MRAHRLSALSSLAWLALVLGCAALPGEPPPPTQAEQAAFEKAVEPTDPEARRAALQEFLASYPDAVLEPEARLELGDLEDAQGDVGLALASWRAVVDESPRSPAADAARLRIAKTEYGLGNLEEARSALAKLRLSRLSPEERRDAYRVQAALTEDPVVRVRSLAMLRGEIVGDAEAAEDADEAAAADETEEAAEVDEAALARVDDDIDIALLGLDASSAERLSRQLGDAPPAARRGIAEGKLTLRAFSEVECPVILPTRSWPVWPARIATARTAPTGWGPATATSRRTWPPAANAWTRRRSATAATRGSSSWTAWRSAAGICRGGRRRASPATCSQLGPQRGSRRRRRPRSVRPIPSSETLVGSGTARTTMLSIAAMPGVLVPSPKRRLSRLYEPPKVS
jgi:tetratricopeptide (TPR) repeat protein